MLGIWPGWIDLSLMPGSRGCASVANRDNLFRGANHK